MTVRSLRDRYLKNRATESLILFGEVAVGAG